MNKFLFFVFISVCSLSGMEEKPKEEKSLSIKEVKNSFIRLKHMRYFYPVTVGLLTSGSLYGLSKTNAPLLKNIRNLSTIKKFLLFFGSGIAAGGFCFIYQNSMTSKDSLEIEGLINRPNGLDFWLTNEMAKECLKLKNQVKLQTTYEQQYQDYLDNIKVAKNIEYWREEKNLTAEQITKEEVEKFLQCDNNFSTYMVRIFNKNISFENLINFINVCDRKRLLLFLRIGPTITGGLQGEFLHDDIWINVDAEKLAAFLAFGYYTDRCGKFLFLEQKILLTFLENAVYYMYRTGDGREEQGDCPIEIRNIFEKECKIRLKNVKYEGSRKDQPTIITMENSF